MVNKLIFSSVLIFNLVVMPASASAGFLKAAVFPSDGDLKFQYYLSQIKAPEAWEIINQAPEIVVAVIDSGMDIDHPDLAENIWRNPNEKKDGIDNDNNGYIDDLNGWDFILNSSDPRPKFGGEYSTLGINHGTLVTGVIGAIGNNNFGLAGISWKIKIMPLKVMDGLGSGKTTAVYHAIKYAIKMGAEVINLSMVGDAFDPLLDKIIAEAYQAGIIIVAAAGNEKDLNGSIQDVSVNLALRPQYPICHDGPQGENYILGVGAVDQFDIKSRFSNFGSRCLDIMAPGESFYGTLFFSPVLSEFNKYFGGWWSGTSLAAPQVSAAAALVKALRPDLTNKEIYQLLINSADKIDDKNPNYKNLLGAGRLNLKNLINLAGGEAVLGKSLILAGASNRKPEIKITSRLGHEQSNFLAYAENFKGGVNLATIDLENDGEKEIITAAAKGGGPHLRIFKSTGELIGQFFAYETNFSGGVNLVAGDLDGDKQPEIITAPQSQFKPLVRIFDRHGNLKKEFLAFEENFNGGVNLTLTDINADGIKEIAGSSGPGREAEIRIFDSAGKKLYGFKPWETGFKGGLKIFAYNLESDARTEILAVPQSNFKPLVRIFTTSGDILKQWLAGEEKYLGGLNLTVDNIDQDSETEIILSQNNEVKIFDKNGGLENSFFVFENDFKGGINLATK